MIIRLLAVLVWGCSLVVLATLTVTSVLGYLEAPNYVLTGIAIIVGMLVGSMASSSNFDYLHCNGKFNFKIWKV